MADDFHTWVVHYCSSLIIHRLKEHTVSFHQKMVCNHCKSKTNCRLLSYLGGRWPMMSKRWGTCVGVHHCISVIIHKLKGLIAILSKIVCIHCTPTTQCPCSSYMGDRWPIMSIQCFDDILIEGGIHVLVVRHPISYSCRLKGLEVI